MERYREELRDDLVSVLRARRELAEPDDEVLADVFLTRLQAHLATQRRPSRWRPLYASRVTVWLSALLVLIAIPIEEIFQQYRERDGYLDPLDWSAMPIIYWIAVIAVVLLLLMSLLQELTGVHLHLRLSIGRKSSRT